MKVLVATKETQGQRKDDFSWCNPDELVYFGFECDGETIDGGCGCRRSMCGMNSHKATTTMKVIDSGISRESYIEMLRISLHKAGWHPEDVVELADELLGHANAFNVGDVVEKRGNKLRVRRK